MKSIGKRHSHILATPLALLSFACVSSEASAQYPYPSLVQGYNPQPVIVAPPPARFDTTNTAGFTTGYSVITSTYERPDPLGHALGGGETVHESTARIVPNDALGQPVRGIQPFAERNSAGWSTGYSAVTSTYERPNPLGRALGGSETVTETTTRVVPNDALGRPMGVVGGLWP
jgi:hypothetical protein